VLLGQLLAPDDGLHRVLEVPVRVEIGIVEKGRRFGVRRSGFGVGRRGTRNPEPGTLNVLTPEAARATEGGSGLSGSLGRRWGRRSGFRVSSFELTAGGWTRSPRPQIGNVVTGEDAGATSGGSGMSGSLMRRWGRRSGFRVSSFGFTTGRWTRNPRPQIGNVVTGEDAGAAGSGSRMSGPRMRLRGRRFGLRVWSFGLAAGRWTRNPRPQTRGVFLCEGARATVRFTGEDAGATLGAAHPLCPAREKLQAQRRRDVLIEGVFGALDGLTGDVQDALPADQGAQHHGQQDTGGHDWIVSP
jgi:hypothetical protein